MAVTDWALQKLYSSPHQLLEDHSNGSLRLGSRSNSNTIGTAAKFDTFFCSLLPSGQTAELPQEGVKGIKRRLLSALYTINKMDFQSHSREKHLPVPSQVATLWPYWVSPWRKKLFVTVNVVTLLIQEHSNHTNKRGGDWCKNLYFFNKNFFAHFLEDVYAFSLSSLSWSFIIKFSLSIFFHPSA